MRRKEEDGRGKSGSHFELSVVDAALHPMSHLVVGNIKSVGAAQNVDVATLGEIAGCAPQKVSDIVTKGYEQGRCTSSGAVQAVALRSKASYRRVPVRGLTRYRWCLPSA